MLEKNVFRDAGRRLGSDAGVLAAARSGTAGTCVRDGKHRMVLLFRWYLGLVVCVVNAGEPTCKVDYQVWCGPAMGAFNERRQPPGGLWRNRRAVTVGQTRCMCLRADAADVAARA